MTEQTPDYRPMWADLGLDLDKHDALQFCTPCQMEAGSVARALQANGLPVLGIDTDYGTGEIGQLRTRIEAFVEQIREG